MKEINLERILDEMERDQTPDPCPLPLGKDALRGRLLTRKSFYGQCPECLLDGVGPDHILICKTKRV